MECQSASPKGGASVIELKLFTQKIALCQTSESSKFHLDFLNFIFLSHKDCTEVLGKYKNVKSTTDSKCDKRDNEDICEKFCCHLNVRRTICFKFDQPDHELEENYFSRCPWTRIWGFICEINGYFLGKKTQLINIIGFFSFFLKWTEKKCFSKKKTVGSA